MYVCTYICIYINIRICMYVYSHLNIYTDSYIHLVPESVSYAFKYKVSITLHICAMTHSYLRHDTFKCDMFHSYLPWLIHKWHDSFTCCEWVKSFMSESCHSYVPWFICIWDMTHSHTTLHLGVQATPFNINMYV